ncbi:DUF2339 domain-containing protein [Bizionia argentinensis JUB59]|uniref:DUF2339 domain-containing protein n=1 Tax=Bizionia argentinensis JUB59 TaxID=1046627 RepID=G2E9F7_9FLAO|nr:DUF2339 domain-containing protein [Bizionia argentinensis]EGV44948.2 DUF2339 domain-containing protein [Bizionia argentinensis JUB59]
MEYVLLIIIIILLIVQNTKYSKERLNLRNEIYLLNEKLNSLLVLYKKTNKSAEKESVKETIQPPPEDPFKTPPIVVTPSVPLFNNDDKEEPEEKPEESIKVAAATKTVMTTAPTEKVKIEPQPGIWERFKQRNPDLEKFIGENLINKIGILILVLGISYFVKFAIDKNWINEPARVGIGILAGSLVLFIAHRLRKKYAPFSSVLVAGSIAIFYFTIAIAYHEYQLFGKEVAFAIMVIITAFSCLISLSYNRMELAVLSLIGGFLVPFMVSSGSGNYIVLFTYIAILDIGILVLAYFKKWHLVHILAFVFTSLLFSGWILNEMDENKPHYLGALIFGFVFYLIFIITNIINNLRTKDSFSKTQLVMLTLNNFVFYGIGMLVLSEFKPEFSGLFTTFLALLNLAYASFLYKKFGLDKIAVYLLIGLTLTFITLAIPVQFSGNNITIFWAIEAVLLMWLAQKSQIKSYRFAAVLVQILMVISLFLDWPSYLDKNPDFYIALNPIFIAGVFVVASFVSVALLLQKESEKLSKFGFTFNPKTYNKIAVALAVITGYLVGFIEVAYQAISHFTRNDFLAIIVVYHLLFSAVFAFALKKSIVNYKIISVLSIFNILLFTFLFFKIPFAELENNIFYNTNNLMAYYLHIISFVLIVYFCYLLYKTNIKEKVLGLFSKKWMIWIAAFISVYILSNEVILQGLHTMSFTIEKDPLVDQFYLVSEMVSAAKHKIVKTALPVLWGVLAFVFLIIGIKKQVKQLRIIALSLLGLTIVKLFVYDISNVSETGKIIAFILLGVLILIISFVYQKIKFLVIDENKTDEDDKID